TSIGIGAVGEPVVADLLEPVLGGPLAHGAAVAISVIVAYLLITSVHITIGELVPKLYAIENADRLVRLVARPLRVSRLIFAPFISGLTFISNRILRLLGVDPDTINEQAENPEELKLIITESLQGGQLDPGEAGMLRGVFHLHEQEARQVMTPIPAVVTVDVSEDVGTALRKCISSGHTRLLVTEDSNTDRVRGLVHASGLADRLMREGAHASIEPIVHDAPIVPETKALDDLLAELQRARTPMAAVAHEYGRAVR